MNKELVLQLQELAYRYETADFIEKDPSKFMHQVENQKESELRAFVAANLAFGRREQILLHVQAIMDAAGSSLENWILCGEYESFFYKGEASFYRMFSHDSMKLFFDSIKKMLEEKGSLGNYFEKKYLEERDKVLNGTSNVPNRNYSNGPLLSDLISIEFPKECNVIPHSADGASKKVNMFLRWMVRDNSPVDMGFWKWYKKTDLLMPLDTHVMQQSVHFGLLSPTASGKVPSASLKTAKLLTDQLRIAFPEDPVKGDFALFGLGVNSK